MALMAGRKGVAPDQVDARGKITAAGLTPEQQAQLDRALLVPVQAPAENKIVGVTTGRDQLMLGIGGGLDVQGGQLVAVELPDYSSEQAGKVLKVNAEGTDVEWADPPQGGGVSIERIDGVVVNSSGVLNSAADQHIFKIDVSGLESISMAFNVYDYPNGNNRILYGFSNDDLTVGDTIPNPVTLSPGAVSVYAADNINITAKYMYVGSFRSGSDTALPLELYYK